MKDYQNRKLPIEERENAWLKEMMKHYNSSNRGFDENILVCVYYPFKTSEGCVIGRELTKKQLKIIETSFNNRTEVSRLYEHETPVLPEWMMDFDKEFLIALQEAHDREDCWNSRGFVKDIKTRKELDDFLFYHGLEY